MHPQFRTILPSLSLMGMLLTTGGLCSCQNLNPEALQSALPTPQPSTSAPPSVPVQSTPSASESPQVQTPTPTPSATPTPTALPTPEPTPTDGFGMELKLEASQLSLSGTPDYYTGTVHNYSSEDGHQLALQALIRQGEELIPAGGALVPLGTSRPSGIIAAHSSVNLAPFGNKNGLLGYPYHANMGDRYRDRLETGPATLIIELRQPITEEHPHGVLVSQEFEIELIP